MKKYILNISHILTSLLSKRKYKNTYDHLTSCTFRCETEMCGCKGRCYICNERCILTHENELGFNNFQKKHKCKYFLLKSDYSLRLNECYCHSIHLNKIKLGRFFI